MAKGIFKLRGIAEYMEQIEAAGGDIMAAATRAVDAGSEVILAGMQRRVPVLTGNLKNHLGQKIETSGDDVIAHVGLLDPDADTARYGNVQEYGSASMPAHPYVRPAFDNDATRARRAMRETLREMIGG